MRPARCASSCDGGPLGFDGGLGAQGRPHFGRVGIGSSLHGFGHLTLVGGNRVVLLRRTRTRRATILASHDDRLEPARARPCIGSEILIGAAAGVAVGVLKLIKAIAPLWLGSPSDSFVQIINLNPLHGTRVAIGEMLAAAGLAVLYIFFAQLLFLLLLRLVLRSNRLAAAAYVLFMSLLVTSQHSQFSLTLVLTAVEMTLTAYLFMRVGLLSVVLMHTVRLLIKSPMDL